MAVRTVTFASHDCDTFVAELKAKVAAYFDTRRISTKANAVMVVRTVVMLSVYLGAYLLILSNLLSPLAMLGLCVLMGACVAGIGFGVSHDALHGAYSENPKVNAVFGFTFDLLGANGYMWKLAHNVIHHTYTNIHGIDEDLEVTPLLRLSLLAKHR